MQFIDELLFLDMFTALAPYPIPRKISVDLKVKFATAEVKILYRMTVIRNGSTDDFIGKIKTTGRRLIAVDPRSTAVRQSNSFQGPAVLSKARASRYIERY